MLIIYLSYNFHFNEGFYQGELFELSPEISTCVCVILDTYLYIILFLSLSRLLISNSKIKIQYPLIYNILIIIIFIILVILIIIFVYFLNKLLIIIMNKMIKIIVKNIEDFIINMQVGGPRSSGNLPGGFGQPVGGGGKPPRKPKDPILPKGHYTEDEKAEKKRLNAEKRRIESKRNYHEIMLNETPEQREARLERRRNQRRF